MSRMLALTPLFLLGALTPTAVTHAQSPTIWYVDADVSTNQTPDGTSWETAFPTLQQAIAAAEPDQDPAEEIWVAQGIYSPGTSVSSTFVLKDGVAVYGGFEGFETELDQRDPNPLTNGTVLFTDITQGTACDVLVTAQGDWPDDEIDRETVLDGFTLTGARKHAIFNYYSHATYRNLLLVGNGSRYDVTAEDGGALLITVDSQPAIFNCTFVDNIATRGGAVAINLRSQGRFTDCYFGGNEVDVPTSTSLDGGGGAIACDASQGTAVSQPRTILRRCIVEDNLADACDGGAILKTGDARMDLVECQFNDNTARGHGGSYPPTEGNGGALCTLSGDVNTVNCIFKGNVSENPRGGSAPAGGGAWYCFKPCETTGVNCLFYLNQTDGDGGAIACILADQQMVNFTITQNQAPEFAGLFVDNFFNVGTAAYVNTIFWGNIPGSPFANLRDAQVKYVAQTHVSYSCVQGTPVFPGQCNVNGDPIFEAPEVYNFHLCPGSPCIDHGDTLAVPSDELDLDADDASTNIPCPIGTDEPTPDLDLRDRVIDPDEEEESCAVGITQCGRANQVVDMGVYEFRDIVCVTGVSGDVNLDGLLDGDDIQPFIHCLYITPDEPIGECTCADMNLDRVLDINDVACFVESLLAGEVLCVPTGGCPFVPETDCNTNGQYDAIDLYFGTSLDCNGNFVSDECDLAGPTSLDANENGVPDECEGDCNGNGVPDDVDVAGPTSIDVNSNGVPDECEPDCNENGTPDSHDIATAFSYDCNSNSRPDECELDCNTNGIPDFCDVRDHASPDCNTNYLPDECDLILPFIPSIDCNTNGTLDECDLAAGTAWDCNTNETLDLCDIALEQSEDADTNGIPDECDVVEQMQYGESQQNNESPGNDCAGEGLESLQIWLLERDVHLLERWQRHALFDKRARQLGLW